MELPGYSFKEYALKLGRSEKFIEKQEAYATILASKDLPVIFSPTHLALSMGKEHEELQSIIENRNSYYKLFKFRKKHSKDFRFILAPTGELKKIHYWVKENILDKLSFPDSVTAYQKTKSIYQNALPHVNKELIIKFDLADYFNTIYQSRIYGLFQILGYNKSVAVDLAKICCAPKSLLKKENINILETLSGLKESSILPQGAPTSPILSNLAALKLDFRLSKYALKHGFAYTRYADDLTFSGTIEQKLKKSIIKKIVVESGFVLNDRKGCYTHKSSKQLVTGLTVNSKVSVSKKKRREINTHLHNCIQFGPYNHMKKSKMKVKANYRDWLLGNILYVYSINPEVGKKMRERFDKIDWLSNPDLATMQIDNKN